MTVAERARTTSPFSLGGATGLTELSSETKEKITSQLIGLQSKDAKVTKDNVVSVLWDALKQRRSNPHTAHYGFADGWKVTKISCRDKKNPDLVRIVCTHEHDDSIIRHFTVLKQVLFPQLGQIS